MTPTGDKLRRDEQLHELETKYAVQYSCGATLYINPTNAFGEDVTRLNGLYRKR